MPKPGATYPQIELGARGLIDTPPVVVPDSTPAGEALRTARARGAASVIVGREVALREDLARAEALGLGDLAVVDLARPVPVASAGTSEAHVRRTLAGGAPAVLVRDGRTVLGVIVAGRAVLPGPALGARVARLLPQRFGGIVGTVRDIALSRGEPALLVGGVVRDLVARASVVAVDLDIVVEGDGHAMARALAEQVHGSLVLHERFLTATVELEDGATVDVITARRERYERPGALPRVMPAAIGEDLRRRDFTMNAMAIELASGEARLLDPHGGRADAARRRLRVLHPLSFVEDPTRMLRAARYAARLGLRADPWTRRCLTFALKLAPYPALSAARIAGELERLLAEPSAAAALAVAVRAGVFRVADARWRATRATLDAVGALDATLRWAATHRVAAPLTVAALVLALEQPPDVATTLVARLGVSGEALLHVQRALAGARRVADRVRRAARASETAAALRGEDGATLVAVRLAGDAATRERVDWFVRAGRAVGSALHGDEVIGLGVPRGPAVSDVLRALRDARLDGRIVDREAEIRYVRALMRSDERKA
jgi:tRNA nucleotidyltransferase (CCA-adding enzyme)